MTKEKGDLELRIKQSRNTVRWLESEIEKEKKKRRTWWRQRIERLDSLLQWEKKILLLLESKLRDEN